MRSGDMALAVGARGRLLSMMGIAVALLAAWPALAVAGHNPDRHSDNMSLVATANEPGGTDREGTDLAFWGDRVINGNYGNPGGFRIWDVSSPAAPRKLGQIACPGPQNDVSIGGDLVFVSVDSARGDGNDPNGIPRKANECGAPTATAAQQQSGPMWEGVRVFSIADPANPVQVAAVQTDCGSHTHTLMPDTANNRVLIYVESYPLGAPIQNCNAQRHRKLSVIEVPLADPAAANVVHTSDVSPAIGCHDVTVLIPRKIAGAACISESQIWDISDPARPRVIAHIANPAINIHHSTVFSWDGKTLVIGDELGGAAAAPGCGPGGEHAPLGALWFYDVTNPSNPTPRGAWRIPQMEGSALCTAHNFNPVPLLTGRNILVSAWYDGGTTVVDFTNPTAVSQVGHYTARTPIRSTTWSSYWYNGHIYGSNWDQNAATAPGRGLDIFKMSDPAVDGALNFSRLNPQTMEPLPTETGLAPGATTARCHDRRRPSSRFSRTALRASRRGIRVSGAADDRGCGRRGRGRVSFVAVAVARRYGRRSYQCRYLQAPRRSSRSNRLVFGPKVRCNRRGQRKWVVAGGTRRWRYQIRTRLPRGRYNIRTRAIDSAVNWERRRDGRGRRVNVLWFRVR